MKHEEIMEFAGKLLVGNEAESQKAREVERAEFVSNLPLVMDRAGRLGLFKTMQKLHEAVREAGWEACGMERPRG